VDTTSLVDAKPPAARRAGLRVLVADDNQDCALSMALLLRRWGHEPHVAFSGEEALEKAAWLGCDAALLDLAMPGLDGWEVARALARLAKPPLLVAVTGHAGGEYRKRSCEAGFDLHLLKPVEPAALARLLDRFGRVVGEG
jgi:CheY-like chemotaxis protein